MVIMAFRGVANLWTYVDGPLQLIRHLSVLDCHTIRMGANGSEPASVRPLSLFLRLFATHDCTVCLEALDGERHEVQVNARQAWFVSAEGLAQVLAAPVAVSGQRRARLYVNEFG